MRKYLFLVAFLFCLTAKAQSNAADSTQVAQRLIALLDICKKGMPSDITKPASVSSAAGYVVCRIDDPKRKWKDTCNYAVADERKEVDGICYRLHSNINQDPNYKIVKYESETESEGKWMVLTIEYTKNDVPKKMSVAFLKIKGVLAIGDID